MAAYSSLTQNYETLLSSTLHKVLGTGAFADNIFKADPLLSWLRGGDRVKVIDGGERIRVPILYEKSSAGGYYSGYDLLDTTAQEGHTTAFFNWKQAAYSVSVSGLELRANSGSKEKLNDIQEAKITQAAKSLSETIATGAYSDGTGSSNKQITGLGAMHATDPTAAASYAEISQADNSSWRNQVQASAGAIATNLMSKLRTLMNDCSQGSGGVDTSPDAIFTTQAVHEGLESLLFPMVRYQPNPSGGADAGIETLKFKGASIMWDDFCSTGELHALNSAHIGMFVHKDANFAMAEGGFQRPTNQDAFVTQILLQANLVTNNRRKGGKIEGLT
tara:strand:+ start:1119 stop:2117 length:999 start_codon:yes stop_codon:yes gene_type:complete